MAGKLLGHIGGDERLDDEVGPVDVHQQQAAQHEAHECVGEVEYLVLDLGQVLGLEQQLVPRGPHAAVPEGDDAEADPADHRHDVAQAEDGLLPVPVLPVEPVEGQEHIGAVVGDEHEDADQPHVHGVGEEDEEGGQGVMQQVLVVAALGLDERVAEVAPHVLPELDVVEHLHAPGRILQVPVVRQRVDRPVAAQEGGHEGGVLDQQVAGHRGEGVVEDVEAPAHDHPALLLPGQVVLVLVFPQEMGVDPGIENMMDEIISPLRTIN